jgi:hypothetical protein
MLRSLVALSLTATLAAACVTMTPVAPTGTTPGETPQGGQPTAAPTATSPAAKTSLATEPPATETPLPSPLEATWTTIQDQADGALVALTGRVRAGPLVSCFSHQCSIFLEDPADSSNDVIFELPAVSHAGVPNTMVELPEHYTENDLQLTADDGSVIASGDVVRLVAWVEQSDTLLSLTAVRLETVPAPSATPTTVTFAELTRLARGEVVRIRGTLSLPFITSCSATCSIHLDDPKSSRWAYIDVPVVGEGDAQRNGMLQLPSNFHNSDLVVFASDGTRLGAGDKAWVTGTLDNDSTEDTRSIRVDTIEPAS